MDRITGQLWDSFIAFIPKLIAAFLIILVGLFIVNWLVKVVDRTMLRRDVDPDVRPFLHGAVNFILKLLVIISAISVLGVETTSVVAGVGALGVAIGLALQGALGHFAAGMLILIFKPYRTGDWISAAGVSGSVTSIQIVNTILATADNHQVIIPNGKIISDIIQNYSVFKERRLDLTFGIGYEDDIDKARSVLTEVAKKTPGLLPDKGIDIMVMELADNSVNLGLRLWTEAAQMWPATCYLKEEVKKAFDRNRIGIPYPQLDVNLKKNGQHLLEQAKEQDTEVR